MNLRLFISILLLAASCGTDAVYWKTLDFGVFTLKTPSEWHTFEEDGIDAYIGGLTDGKDSLWFYYGRYISGPKDDQSSTHLFAQDTINGFSSVIITPKHDGNGKVEMFIPNVTERDKFLLSGYDIRNTQTVLQIFKSVAFTNSDTTKNGVLTKSKFKEYPFGSGYTLYYGFCSLCHSIEQHTWTPPLKNLLEAESPNSLSLFLKSKDPIFRNDSIVNSEHQNIRWFDTLTANDIKMIFGFVTGQ